MEKEELKKYETMNTENLSDTVGGHRHKAYTAGHYVGKAMQAVGVGVGIAVGLASLFVAKPNGENK